MNKTELAIEGLEFVYESVNLKLILNCSYHTYF